jgi:hypothetical protein
MMETKMVMIVMRIGWIKNGDDGCKDRMDKKR